MTDLTKTLFDRRPVEDWLESQQAAGRLSGGVMEIRQAGSTVFFQTFKRSVFGQQTFKSLLLLD